jgi:hypothetical protein
MLILVSGIISQGPKVFVSTAFSGAVKDSRQRKTREALEKLTAVYSVPELRMAP